MKITVLVENTTKNNLKCEHGLSIYIEHKDNNYLLDTGRSNIYLENAKQLGIDLSKVDAGFLSHGHYDHSGGFEEFFKHNTKAKVYLQEACKQKQYYKIIGPVKKYIGIPKGILEKYNNRFEYVRCYKEIAKGVHICPHTTHNLTTRGKRTHMYTKENDKFIVDDFSHEQTVVFEENNNLYLFNSCSHSGVENIIQEVKEIFPDKEIKAFFGGFHMIGKTGINSCEYSKKEVKEIGNTLLKNNNATFYTGHCTGNIASKWLKEVLKDRFVKIHTGMVITF